LSVNIVPSSKQLAQTLRRLVMQGAQVDGDALELPGLEGRCHDAGWALLCTGGDGRRDLLRLAASRAIQRGDLARRVTREAT
jgi:hypothetical protein